MTATFCTIIARNYLAQALILGESLAVHHPGSRLQILVIDAHAGVPDVADRPVDVLRPADVMPQADFDVMAGLYPIVELATAVKPWLLATLVDASGGPVLYMDPDIKVYAPLDRLIALAIDPGVVLTPHLDVPPDRADGLVPVEDIVLSAGVYNLGFVGVGPAARGLLDWWQSRLARECVNDPTAQRFVDQRWMDLAPGYFAVAVVRDPEYNIAWWNLSTRQVAWTGTGYLINGRPLGFFHFSGYSPTSPHLVSKHQGPKPRVLLSDAPDLARILAEYAADLARYGHAAYSELPNGLETLPNGLTMDCHMRALYRRAVLDADREGGVLPPNPYTQTDAFFAWLRAPAPTTDATDPTGLGRYAAEVRDASPHLHSQFPDVLWADCQEYVAWFTEQARIAGRFPTEVIPEAPPVARGVARRDRIHGVNLIGYMRTESGVGEAARQIASGLAAAKVPFVAVDYSYSPGRQGHAFPTVPRESAPYDINLLCINADQILTANHWLGPDLRDVERRIGVWWWEVADFPEAMHEALTVIDELWVGSAFIAEAFRKITDKPVHVMPLPVQVPLATVDARAALDLDDGFLVLFSFDFESVFARKNPLAAIEAYRTAFAADEGATLLIKTINGHRHLTDLERLRFAVTDRPDIRVVDGYLDHEVKDSLMQACDCYLSLHRSEGFGLTMAEAMAHGRPVVATAYSGNLEFMTAENSWLVPWTEARVPRDTPPYPPGTLWAEPDVAAAAKALREAKDDPAEAARRGGLGQATIRERQNPARLAEFARSRLEAIRAEIARRPAPDPLSDPGPELRDTLVERVNQAGATPWDAEGGGGAANVTYRRGLLRALRPYLMRRDEIDRAIVARTDQIADATDAAQRALERDGQRVDELATTLASRLKAIEKATEMARLEAADLRRRLGSVESDLRLPASLDLAGRGWPSRDIARAEMARRWAGVGIAPVAAPDDAGPLTSHEYRCSSQNGEDGVICEIFHRIGVTNRWFAEFGIESGVEGNSVLLAESWSGLFIEADGEAFRALSERYARRARRIRLLHAAVTRENINELFREGGAPESPDLVSIDVDGTDYWLWDALELEPRVLVIEYNAALGFEERLSVPYSPDHRWDGTDYFGASLAGLTALGHRRGYRLVHTDRCGVNAFFVRADLAEGRFPDEVDVPRHTANYFFSGGGHPPDPEGRAYVAIEQTPTDVVRSAR